MFLPYYYLIHVLASQQFNRSSRINTFPTENVFLSHCVLTIAPKLSATPFLHSVSHWLFYCPSLSLALLFCSSVFVILSTYSFYSLHCSNYVYELLTLRNSCIPALEILYFEWIEKSNRNHILIASFKSIINQWLY